MLIPHHRPPLPYLQEEPIAVEADAECEDASIFADIAHHEADLSIVVHATVSQQHHEGQ